MTLCFLLSLMGTLTLSYPSLVAQDKGDSSSAAGPKLGGKWLLSARLGAGPYVVMFTQSANKLRGDFAAEVSCAGKDVKMSITLEGDVSGNLVRLRATRGRILSGNMDSDQAQSCSEYQVLTNTVDFRGQLSADGKTIVGTYDETGDPTHVWRFTR